MNNLNYKIKEKYKFNFYCRQNKLEKYKYKY